MTDLEISRLSAAEKEEKLQRELEWKKPELSVFHTQQKSWEESIALKDKDLGFFRDKVELQCLTLAELSLKVEALQKELSGFRKSNEEKKILTMENRRVVKNFSF
ncbi:hypothetical protein Fot_11172 [Forsythia ovata]|uniref:Uncharacterized protein n=1 Tax=Forsythia ovata TaxID=205694 RepID=A0ABD1WIY2_9LAMI